MQRQLREKGGVMSVAPREKFGFGSSFKRAVRKIIPNEVAKVATVAAPFVAPFNPQLAGAMAGIGSFDQTGSISNALKSGALTYGGGQLARYVGGAGFQDPSMSLQGFTNLSSPITGNTIFRGFGAPKVDVSGITGINEGALQKTVDKAALENLSPEKRIAEEATQTFIENQAKTNVTPAGVTELLKKGQYGDAAKLAAEKGAKAIFLDKDNKLDKNVLLAAGSFGLSYADAKKVAADAGVDIGTEEEYDEATKAEKQKTYAGYLTNFFEGKKDGGRIGYASGSDIFGIGGEEVIPKMGEKMGEGASFLSDLITDSEGNVYTVLQYLRKFGEDAFFGGQKNPELSEKFYNKLGDDYIQEMKTVKERGYNTGGRIGYMFGDKVEDKEGIMSMPKDKEDEDMRMAYFPGDVFSKDEISRLFSDRSLTSNQDRKDLYKILMNPGMYPEAEDALIKLLRGKQDGGRIGFESGTMPMADSSFKFTELIEDDTDEKEKLINELMEKGYRFEDIMQLVSPKTERLMDDGTYKQYGDAPSISLGKIGFNMGGEVPVKKNKAGIEELDYRQTGGFVPVGVKEKADDVPAMLSKNEFVLTADAVRGIGGGDVEKGAEKLYGVMKQAEKVGKA